MQGVILTHSFSARGAMIVCPLCEAPDSRLFFRDKLRAYFRCDVCDLIFVPPEYFLSPSEEKKRYDLHRNSPHDEKYRAFLDRLFRPLQKRLAPGRRGLDFGSGPGPTLSVMFEEAGYPMTLYDAFYAKDAAALEKQYDFITATEVLEHLHDPKRELECLWQCLKPGGILGVMTKLALGAEAFAGWHYKNDETHVCFFSGATFRWWAASWQAEVAFEGQDVIFFRKKP